MKGQELTNLGFGVAAYIERLHAEGETARPPLTCERIQAV